jgi:DNA-binding IclR family transcriptional regulator
MIKVLSKMFSILEEIVIASPNPVSAGKLADKFGINKATCSRIIGDLVSCGYIKQVSRMEGYVAGPRAYSFGVQVSYKEHLLMEVSPMIEECAEDIGESVLIAEMCKGQRYITCHYNYNPSMNIFLNQLAYDDLYDTATGIMLLAHASQEDVDAIISENGFPTCSLWSTISTKEDMYEFLKNIKNNGSYMFDGPTKNGLSIAAFPVFQNGECISVIGVSVPHNDFKGKHKDRVLRAVKLTATKISMAISSVGSVG